MSTDNKISYLEAINAVEKALTLLKVKDKFGEPCIGIQAIGVLHKFAPEKLTGLESIALSDPLRYLDGMLRLIRSYSEARKEKRMEACE